MLEQNALAGLSLGEDPSAEARHCRLHAWARTLDIELVCDDIVSRKWTTLVQVNVVGDLEYYQYP